MKKKTLLSLFCLTICNSFIFLKIKTLIAGKNLPSHHQATGFDQVTNQIHIPVKLSTCCLLLNCLYATTLEDYFRAYIMLHYLLYEYEYEMNIYNGFIYPSEHLIRWFTTLSVLAIFASSRFLYRSSHVKLKILFPLDFFCHP